MEIEQNQPIEEQKQYPQLSETLLSGPAKKDAVVDEPIEDWESLRFDLPEDECNETNYADWIANASAKNYDIKARGLAELKAFSSPPQKVVNAYKTIYYILRKKNRPYSGKMLKELFGSPKKLIEEIKSFDHSTLSYKNCVSLKKKLEGESPEATKSCSLVAAVLIDWAITATKLRIVSGIYEES